MARFGAMLSLVLSVFWSVATLAQSNYVAVGIPQNSATIPIPLGFVDPLSGQVHLEIPYASIPQRNGAPLIAKYIYDSTYYVPYPSSPSQFGPGWQLVWGPSNRVRLSFLETEGACPPTYPIGQIYNYSNFAIIDANGTFVSLFNYPLSQWTCQDSNGNHIDDGVYSGGGISFPAVNSQM